MLVAEINRSRLLGCEYEFALPVVGAAATHDVLRNVAHVLSSNGLRAGWRTYSHDPVPAHYDLMVETDSSVQGETRWQGVHWQAIELKTRPLTYPQWQQIVPRALSLCAYLGGRCTPSAGHHVHVSLPEVQQDCRVLRSVFNVYHKFENVIFGCLAPSRKHNRYAAQIPANRYKMLQSCKSLRCFERVLSDHGFDRYNAVNFTHAFGTAPRIEYRHSQSTLNPQKAEHWLRAVLQLTEHAATRTCQASEQLPNTKQSLERLLTSCGFKSVTGIYSVSDELKETGRFLRGRWKHFSLRQAQTEGEG